MICFNVILFIVILNLEDWEFLELNLYLFNNWVKFLVKFFCLLILEFFWIIGFLGLFVVLSLLKVNLIFLFLDFIFLNFLGVIIVRDVGYNIVFFFWIKLIILVVIFVCEVINFFLFLLLSIFLFFFSLFLIKLFSIYIVVVGFVKFFFFKSE